MQALYFLEGDDLCATFAQAGSFDQGCFALLTIWRRHHTAALLVPEEQTSQHFVQLPSSAVKDGFILRLQLHKTSTCWTDADTSSSRRLQVPMLQR